MSQFQKNLLDHQILLNKLSVLEAVVAEASLLID